MWADNETDIDLLGFDFLVDELIALLREPSIFPLTIGVTGDWGSGKSSVLKMAAAELDKDAAFIVVRFSPWQFEGYEDVKSALMATVMNSLRDAVAADETLIEKSRKLLSRLIRRVNFLAGARLAGKASIAVAGGVTPDPVSLATDVIDLIKPEPGDDETEAALQSVAEFRRDFEELLEGLEKITGLVVFVDDIDRCLPDTIIETFEAIRLFLHVPKAAYVIAADERIVKGAIQHRYPEATAATAASTPSGLRDLRQDYLEKLVQMKLVLPPLAAPEAVSYINLLLAQINSTPEQFELLRAAAATQRRAQYVGVTMDYAVAKVALDTVSEPLTEAFQVAAQIAPILSRQLRGNPRQLKRFLNTQMLRRRAAERRGVSLDFAVLAKLGVLEEVDITSFSRVFDWQAAQDGRSTELEQAESFVIDNVVPADGVEGEVAKWVADARIAEWIRIEPKLGGRNLAPYFFFSRERLAISIPGTRLSPDEQRILEALDGTIAATRSAAIKEVLAAAPTSRAAVFTGLIERSVRKPESPAAGCAIEIAARERSLAPALAAGLDRIPSGGVPNALPFGLNTHFGADKPPEVVAVLEKWEASAAGMTKAAATRALGRGKG